MRDFTPIKLVEVITKEIGTPTNDGSPDSSLYQVPIRLSATPPNGWRELFVRHWDHPSQYTPKHRPGIARVVRDKVLLDGTTLEEVESHHRDTLVLAIEAANQEHAAILERRAKTDAIERQRVHQHREHVAKAAKRIRFD